jgi:hypothetical protein
VASLGVATLARWPGSGMNSEARGREGGNWNAAAAGKPKTPAEPGSCLSVLRLTVINCEAVASLIRSSCATSSLAEITGNSSERTKTKLISPENWVRRLFLPDAAQWTNAPTAIKNHNKLREASTPMCTQGYTLSAASTVVRVGGRNILLAAQPLAQAHR